MRAYFIDIYTNNSLIIKYLKYINSDKNFSLTYTRYI